MEKFDNIFEIPCYAKVEFHPYRTASAKMVFMTLERGSDAGKELEEMLLERAREDAENPNSVQKDNHICYSFSPLFDSNAADDTKLVVKVSDRNISIGVGLVRGYW